MPSLMQETTTAAAAPIMNATPAKSILKPSSVLGRRTTEDAGIDEGKEAPESPTKRRKVLFDEVRNRTYQVGHRSMEEIKREVREALEEHRRGNDGPYDTLKELFGEDSRRHSSSTFKDGEEALKPHELRAYVIALTSCMPVLKDKECNGLVKTVLGCSWLGRDEEFVKVYTYFLAALISAQGTYLLPVLSMIVGNFMLTRPSEWSVNDYPEVGREMMRGRLHQTLQHLLQIFPAASSVLENMLGSKFPFPNDSLRTHMAYIHNILRVKDYVPELQDEVLDIILTRAVKIDSQMQVDLEDLDDDITTGVMHVLRENQRESERWEDESDNDSDTDSVDSDDPEYEHDAVRIKTVTENVEKLDAILDTLFAYHTPLIAHNPSSDKAYVAFTTILREFEHLVLPTYKSRHTQFLAFHFAQMDERLTDAFCGQMIHISFDRSTPSVLKQACIAYLASFVARGAHVPTKDVRSIFDLIVTHMNLYSEKFEAGCHGPDLKRYSTFYNLAQAAMYIFCFRWQDLVVSAPEVVDPEDPASYIGQDLEWFGAAKKDLTIHIFGKFNPLRVCAPVIVEEFAKLAHRLNFVYVYSLLEANKRLRLTQYMTSYATGGALRDAGVETGDESLHQLDPYFPFDPYQLPASKRWLEGDYVQWTSIPGLNADDDDDDSDDLDEEEDVEDFEEATATDSEGGDKES